MWLLLGALILAFVYVGALLATMPASALRDLVAIPSQVTGLYGSVWNGRATLDGGYVLDWTTRPGAILTGGIETEVTLRGEDTLLTGTLRATPLSVSMRDLTGRAGGGLLRLAPGVRVTSCTARATVAVPLLRFARSAAAADGRVTIEPGDCLEPSGRITPVPQVDVALTTEGNDAVARLRSANRDLAQFTLAGDRRVIVSVQPEGAALVPGLPTGGEIRLEYPF